LETELTDGSAGYDVRYVDANGTFQLPLTAMRQLDAIDSFDMLVVRVVGVEQCGREAEDARDGQTKQP